MIEIAKIFKTKHILINCVLANLYYWKFFYFNLYFMTKPNEHLYYSIPIPFSWTILKLYSYIRMVHTYTECLNKTLSITVSNSVTWEQNKMIWLLECAMNSKCCDYKLINKHSYKSRNIDNYLHNTKSSLKTSTSGKK